MMMMNLHLYTATCSEDKDAVVLSKYGVKGWDKRGGEVAGMLKKKWFKRM
jgi:hypothetical protein